MWAASLGGCTHGVNNSAIDTMEGPQTKNLPFHNPSAVQQHPKKAERLPGGLEKHLQAVAFL